MKILQNSKEIAEAIKSILSSKSGERIIAVAYVGNDATSYLPNPDNIQLYCSTEIPGTNPASLRRLKDSGVSIYEVKRLHSKIYWSNKGAVVCSANLSNNGLSENGNHEFGVLIESSAFDIRTYISKKKSTIIHYSEIERLEKKYNLYMLRNKNAKAGGKNHIPAFNKWTKEKGPNWKIYTWSENADLPKDVQAQLNAKYPNIDEYEYILAEDGNSYEIGGWVLLVKEEYEGNELVSVSDLSWFIPEIAFKSNQKNSASYPFYWVQTSSRLPTTKPFNISSRKFEAAFRETYMEFINNEKKIFSKSYNPTKTFTISLRDNMK